MSDDFDRADADQRAQDEGDDQVVRPIGYWIGDGPLIPVEEPKPGEPTITIEWKADGTFTIRPDTTTETDT